MTALAPACAAAFAALAYAATAASKTICTGIVPFDDGPRPGKPRAAWLVAAAAGVGAVLASRHASAQNLMLAAILCAALVACCYSDISCGIVPDAFTLVPLAAVLAYSAIVHDAWPAVSALVVFAPFALAAA